MVKRIWFWVKKVKLVDKFIAFKENYSLCIEGLSLFMKEISLRFLWDIPRYCSFIALILVGCTHSKRLKEVGGVSTF